MIEIDRLGVTDRTHTLSRKSKRDTHRICTRKTQTDPAVRVLIVVIMNKYPESFASAGWPKFPQHPLALHHHLVFPIVVVVVAVAADDMLVRRFDNGVATVEASTRLAGPKQVLVGKWASGGE